MRALPLAIVLAGMTAVLDPSCALAQSAPDGELSLELVCHGQGRHNQATFNSIFAFSGGRSAQGFGVSSQSVQSADTVRVRIHGQESTVRIPRELYSGKFHNSAPDGWLKLIDVETTPTEIKGKVDFFLMSHPQLRIDRDTGDIEIHGNGAFNYSGNCEKAPTETTPKF